MATTKTTKGTKATTKTTENSKSIAEAIVSAKTSSQKAAANRRLSSLQKRRKSEGADPKMVKAGVQSWVTRLRSKSK